MNERLLAKSGGNNTKYVREVVADRINAAYLLYEKGDYRESLEMARAARALAAMLSADKKNAQGPVDESNLRWHFGRALLAVGNVAEATAVLEENVAALQAIAEQGDTLQVQYVLAASEQALGQIHARRAEWRVARDLFARAIPRFKRVTDNVTLDHMDQRPVDEAHAGLARCEAEMAKLQRT